MNIPEEAFAEILEELEKRPLEVNKYRNISGEGRSQAFGLVGRRCLPPDYSRQCWKRPLLYKLLLEFGKKHVPFEFTSITVNDNYLASKHRDKGNSGDSFLVAFGSFTGGELKVHEGPLEGVHDIKNKALVTDFSKIYHSVEPFEGKRYSLVYYNLKNKVDVPPPSVIEQDGKFLFKRGEEVILKGLPHPLKGRKKDAPSVRFEHKTTVITFD